MSHYQTYVHYNIFPIILVRHIKNRGTVSYSLSELYPGHDFILDLHNPVPHRRIVKCQQFWRLHRFCTQADNS